jgi:SAM-dependent MidA family methyltransferase
MPTLQEIVVSRIAASPQRRIPFADYMNWVLYEPGLGYYATRADRIGMQGDFYTSPHLGTDFAELLAEQLVEMWHVLGQPSPFEIVEMGAGCGILAANLLQYLSRTYPAFWQVVRYSLVETSPALRFAQQQRLETAIAAGRSVQWLALEETPRHAIVGCFFSNELVDAFPVHLVRRHNGQLEEIYVTLTDELISPIAFKEVIGNLSTPRLADYFNLVDIDLTADAYPEGYRSEVNLAALDWVQAVAARLKRGYLLTIDYGYSATKYYSPARSRGTLACYYQHTAHDNPYLHIGQQDITSHINFTALERQGEQCGLHRMGFTQQGLFLTALGLGERLASLTASDAVAAERGIEETLRRRQELHLLIHPHELGNWNVLLQGKGLTATEFAYPLRGFRCERSPIGFE